MTPYRIETERLSLQCHDPRRAERSKRAEDESRAHIAAFLPWAARGPETLDEVMQKLRVFRSQFDADEIWAFAAIDRATDAYVGSVSLRPVENRMFNVGYWVHASWVRRGIAKEMTAAAVRMAFEMKGARGVVIKCLEDNVASAKVAETVGFPHRAILPGELSRGDGTFGDALVYTMLRSDYDVRDVRETPFAAFDVMDRPILLQRGPRSIGSPDT